MSKLKRVFLCLSVLAGCDLQPKISSIPDDIGMFIEDRFPALLADPDTQPEIYNSAVTDYGVYASPDLYGSSKVDDYVMYASVDDYVLVPESEQNMTPIPQKKQSEIKDDYIVVPVYGGISEVEEKTESRKPEISDDVIIVAKGDTVYSLARKNNLSVEEFAKINNLKSPYTLQIGQKLHTKPEIAETKVPNVISEEKVKEIKTVKQNESIKPNNTTKVELQEITVAKGDTLYSISRKYQIPVNDLAVMNKLSAPFALSVGQKIKVPKLDAVQTRSVSEIKQIQKVQPKQAETAKTSTTKPVENAKIVSSENQQKTKISSDPSKQLPKISARSNAKFSWPVRGKILSGYGAKNNGLFNDGINISASKGTDVKAAENGVVAYAGNEVKGMGNLVIIQHSDGWMTVYAHMDSMSVRRGNTVSVGQNIGKIGMTGKVDKPQLHFEIRKGTKAYDPVAYLKK